VKFEWSPEGFERVLAHGLDPADVSRALGGPGPRLLEVVADDMVSVLVHTAAGELIEVWLREDPVDDAWEVFVAFDAGFLGKAKWANAFRQSSSSSSSGRRTR
jgi:hypothetical protein